MTSDDEQEPYRILPLRFTSRLIGKASMLQVPIPLRKILFGSFCWAYGCNMEEAIHSDYTSYSNFSELFRRKLQASKRPISKEQGVVSPSDGSIMHFGLVSAVGELNPIKAPGDYHRFHSPTNWTVALRRHFPGLLLSVRPKKIYKTPSILHFNERVCYLGEWKYGFFSLTAVGATNVGSIVVDFDKELKTNRTHLWPAREYPCFEQNFNNNPVTLKAGQDFGEFNFGSTIVLIFEAPRGLNFALGDKQKVRFGQLMAY